MFVAYCLPSSITSSWSAPETTALKWLRMRDGGWEVLRSHVDSDGGGCKHRYVNTSSILVHQHFVALLQRVTPSDEIMRVTSELLKQKWKDTLSELADERRRWQNRLTDVKERIRGFLGQANTAPSEIVKKAIYEEVDRLATEKDELEKLMAEQAMGEGDFESTLESVYGFLRNPCAAWIEGELAHKRMIQKLVFPHGIRYEPKNGFRNPNYALPFRLFEVPEGEKDNLVDPNGFEPTTSCLQSRRSTN